MKIIIEKIIYLKRREEKYVAASFKKAVTRSSTKNSRRYTKKIRLFLILFLFLLFQKIQIFKNYLS